MVSCAQPPGSACAPGTGSASVVFTLYFGQSIPGRGNVTNQEWQSFQDKTITANLPNGYTILNATGAWMNPITHQTIIEPTKVLTAVLPQVADSFAAISRVRTAYQLAFRQQLVGMTIQPGCATF